MRAALLLLAAIVVAGCAGKPKSTLVPAGPSIPGLGLHSLFYVAKANDGYRLVLMRPESASVVAMSKEPLMSPAISADGRRLAYVGFRGGRAGIYEQDLEGGKLRTLASEPGINSAPAYAPDGRIAYVLSVDGSPDIYVADPATGERTRLTDHSAIDTEPTWSPDGRQIAFTSDRAGQPQVYLLDVATREVRVLSREGRQNGRPRFSPDGRSLAMVTNEGGFRIAVVDLASGARKVLTAGPEDESPSFSPDGQLLAYAGRGANGTSELRLVSVDGTTRQRLAGVDGRDPVFAPD